MDDFGPIIKSGRRGERITMKIKFKGVLFVFLVKVVL